MSLSDYGPIAGLVGQAYDALASMSTTRLVLFLLVNVPIFSIIFNAIYQLVRDCLLYDVHMVRLKVFCSCPRIVRCHRWYGTGFRGLALRLPMVKIP